MKDISFIKQPDGTYEFRAFGITIADMVKIAMVFATPEQLAKLQEHIRSKGLRDKHANTDKKEQKAGQKVQEPKPQKRIQRRHKTGS